MEPWILDEATVASIHQMGPFKNPIGDQKTLGKVAVAIGWLTVIGVVVMMALA